MKNSRDLLLRQLAHYAPLDAADKNQAKRIELFVTGNPHCFERTNLVGHITGSAWVMNREGTHVLLTHHRKLNKWLQLGGHADGDPNILTVALKEAREESGLQNIEPVSNDIFDVDIHPIPERKNEPAHLHYDIRFAFVADSAAPIAVSAESHELAWVPLEGLDQLTDEPSMLRMREKWLKK
jgi:8-oxo-dGTP pyrophosphatase MutT (NUDIX family)